MTEAIEPRLTYLEEKSAHQERLLEELSRCLYEQQRAIDRMEMRLMRCEQRLVELGETLEPRLPHEKPPHY